MKNSNDLKNIKTNLFLIYLSLFMMTLVILFYQFNFVNVQESINYKIGFFCIFLVSGFILFYSISKFDKGVFEFKKSLINKIEDNNITKLVNSSVDKKYEIDRMQFVIDKTSYSKIHLTNVINFSDFSIGTGWGRSYYRGNYINNNFLIWNFPNLKSYKRYRSYLVNRSAKYNLASVFTVVILLDILAYFSALFYLDTQNASMIISLILLSIPVLLICHLYFSLEHYLIPMGYFRHELDALIYNKNNRFKLNFIESNSQGLTVIVNYISDFLTSKNTIDKSLILETEDVSEIHQVVYNYFINSKK